MNYNRKINYQELSEKYYPDCNQSNNASKLIKDVDSADYESNLDKSILQNLNSQNVIANEENNPRDSYEISDNSKGFGISDGAYQGYIGSNGERLIVDYSISDVQNKNEFGAFDECEENPSPFVQGLDNDGYIENSSDINSNTGRHSDDYSNKECDNYCRNNQINCNHSSNINILSSKNSPNFTGKKRERNLAKTKKSTEGVMDISENNLSQNSEKCIGILPFNYQYYEKNNLEDALKCNEDYNFISINKIPYQQIIKDLWLKVKKDKKKEKKKEMKKEKKKEEKNEDNVKKQQIFEDIKEFLNYAHNSKICKNIKNYLSKKVEYEEKKKNDKEKNEKRMYDLDQMVNKIKTRLLDACIKSANTWGEIKDKPISKIKKELINTKIKASFNLIYLEQPLYLILSNKSSNKVNNKNIIENIMKKPENPKSKTKNLLELKMKKYLDIFRYKEKNEEIIKSLNYKLIDFLKEEYKKYQNKEYIAGLLLAAYNYENFFIKRFKGKKKERNKKDRTIDKMPLFKIIKVKV